ncbi:unnamed protein product [Vicia faba]|uniref:Uncharacterized protein n=1 Tax=Vicia faba TaxID=3906 RepID=A0AAV0ZX54_VICFA|nr:unnamed protein product [Vicia faba]
MIQRLKGSLGSTVKLFHCDPGVMGSNPAHVTARCCIKTTNLLYHIKLSYNTTTLMSQELSCKIYCMYTPRNFSILLNTKNKNKGTRKRKTKTKQKLEHEVCLSALKTN